MPACCICTQFCLIVLKNAHDASKSCTGCGGILLFTNYMLHGDLYKKKTVSFIFINISNLKGQCHEIFCFWFFYESVFPQPRSIPLGPFQIFSQIRGDIRSSRCTTSVVDLWMHFCLQVHFKVSAA